MARQTTKLNRERAEHARAEARILELKRQVMEPRYYLLCRDCGEAVAINNETQEDDYADEPCELCSMIDVEDM